MRRLQPNLYYSKVNPNFNSDHKDLKAEYLIKRAEVFILLQINSMQSFISTTPKTNIFFCFWIEILQ